MFLVKREKVARLVDIYSFIVTFSPIYGEFIK